MVRKAKASAGIAPFGEKKQDTLIELQDSRTYGNDSKQQQDQLQEQMNLRMLEEQEASIRQLEVNVFNIVEDLYMRMYVCMCNYVIYIYHLCRVTLVILTKYSKILEL